MQLPGQASSQLAGGTPDLGTTAAMRAGHAVQESAPLRLPTLTQVEQVSLGERACSLRVKRLSIETLPVRQPGHCDVACAFSPSACSHLVKAALSWLEVLLARAPWVQGK